MCVSDFAKKKLISKIPKLAGGCGWVVRVGGVLGVGCDRVLCRSCIVCAVVVCDRVLSVVCGL